MKCSKDLSQEAYSLLGVLFDMTVENNVQNIIHLNNDGLPENPLTYQSVLSRLDYPEGVIDEVYEYIKDKLLEKRKADDDFMKEMIAISEECRLYDTP